MSDSFKTRRTLTVGSETVHYYSLPALEAAGFPGVSRLPYSLRILLENLLRKEDGAFVKKEDVATLAGWDVKGGAQREIAFMPPVSCCRTSRASRPWSIWPPCATAWSSSGATLPA
jgi:aconitase A